MISYDVRFTNEADQSVERTIEWFCSDENRGGFDLADRWFKKLESEVLALKNSPERHRLAVENGRWRPEWELKYFRFVPWKQTGWRVIFTIDSEDRVVWIVQIRHEHQRYLHELDNSK